MYLTYSLPTPSDFGLEVSPEFSRIVGIVRFAKTFHTFPLVLLGNALVPKTADIQSNLVGWRHLTRLDPQKLRSFYLRGNQESREPADN